ncbi:DUF4373 domain-containing protein [Lactiplantibacillus mudanjiangensis]|uniref:Lin1244/Lin1753-like N-terminal domain-containing protein n=1 Tax=Lactiplantibacillus mudanjiangensis TaxID=1296538 RepID=A0A660E1D1_9LACO|nr:DUF4373 domain-containing protein [Lactiplantibacillus mudanjiangensis]VDG23695.1 hypothetical protein [Lactobacillus plantarum subsp. plantarum] [Lactiplantibacillus mudanjiangensis]VDG27838.1 hypothetical protein [Lactobacillus plantarum subsp. plantarum] [Lactiplantibacillus mudanjiangensis]
MARPIKKGIDYFNLDVDFFHDIKVRKILRACGNQSISVLICLLCNIYQDDGYYMRWDEDMRFLVADDVDAKESAVQDVVKRACTVGFFDESLFEEYKILTSKRIQENYKLAAKQKKDSSIDARYRLPRVPNDDNGVSMNGNSVSSNDNPHSISEQSKSDNNKEKNKPRDPRDAIREEFNLKVWAIYPKKRDFQKAYDAYYAAKLEGVSLDTITAKIEEYKTWLKLNDTGEYYTKSLENWLIGRCWMDEYDMTPPKPKSVQGGRAPRKELVPGWAKDPNHSSKNQLTDEQRKKLAETIAAMDDDVPKEKTSNADVDRKALADRLAGLSDKRVEN